MDVPFPVNFDGNSYDLKQFLRDHPGGVNTLKYYKGKSIVGPMKKFGHSLSAYHILNDLKVSERVQDSNLTGDVSANGRIITKDENDKDAQEIALLEELEGRLDWSQPLLGQLERVAPHYTLWVNSPVYRRCRLFSSPLLESLTFTPWYLVPCYWLPIIFYLGWSQFALLVACADSCPQESLTSLGFVYHLVFGACMWTFLEYTLHRWVFHLDPGASITWIKLHFLIHGLHHKTPFDGLRQVFPPVAATVLTLGISGIISVLFTYPTIKVVGGLTGYLTYDLIHYYVHHGSPVDGSYLYAMKRYHSNHHFINHDKAFGISSKFWDIVFRTFVHVKKLGFSLRW